MKEVRASGPVIAGKAMYLPKADNTQIRHKLRRVHHSSKRLFERWSLRMYGRFQRFVAKDDLRAVSFCV